MQKDVSSAVELLHKMVTLAVLQSLGLEHGMMRKRQPVIIVERRGFNAVFQVA